MAHEEGHQRVVAIVSAFNEERDIAGVLCELASYSRFDEVIVVDDGSHDATAEVAATFPVRVIRLEENKGKGAAMQIGVQASGADIIFFCDADMRGLTHTMLESVLTPVLSKETEMVIAMRNWRMYYAGFVLTLIPILGGQRALTRSLWEKVPAKYRERFMAETALNFYARYWGRGYQYIVVPGLKQTIKEQKYGFWRGLKGRLRMSGEVVYAQVVLQLKEVPRTIASGRIALRNMIGAFFGIAIGIAVTTASYVGPAAFLRELFAPELLEDPNTPLINFLLNIATNFGADLIALIGVSIVIINILAVFLNLSNLHYLAYRPSAAERIG